MSDVAKTFGVLGWFSPTIIKVKILMQRLWELKIDWDDPLPPNIHDTWLQWKSELKLLSDKHLPRFHFPDAVNVVVVELHRFCDASEHAYAGVVYLRMIDSTGCVLLSIVTSKTKVAPIKRLTIPVSNCVVPLYLHNCCITFSMLPLNCIYAWTDSTVVLS